MHNRTALCYCPLPGDRGPVCHVCRGWRLRGWDGEEGAGWQWRLDKHPEYRGEAPVTQPQFWLQPRWHVENRPVVGVSWYEAAAYCAWLTGQSEREYRLPDEFEWERAARHTDGRDYPWGNEWEDGIINSSEARINRTSAVGAFPRGGAVCGAHDMSGNVFEWTASFFDDSQNTYVVRGGAWFYERDIAHTAIAAGPDREFSGSQFGFRVVAPVS
jgi:formylglycine-generating enzyme required for sulfatase activity